MALGKFPTSPKTMFLSIASHQGGYNVFDAGPPKVPEYNSIGSSVSQLPASDKWLHVDPEYLSEA
jgi:hypothetical protein